MSPTIILMRNTHWRHFTRWKLEKPMSMGFIGASSWGMLTVVTWLVLIQDGISRKWGVRVLFRSPSIQRGLPDSMPMFRDPARRDGRYPARWSVHAFESTKKARNGSESVARGIASLRPRYGLVHLAHTATKEISGNDINPI
ncbi:hypothetical protein K440DRAFT_641855 [Wilcoxina mikolae CBS 423.85]|nr:hypothetical protein K440DRAFT_641855 [Wilcoxina mikolae CBS 423.85]